jgi:hypothetical protein
MDSISAEIRKEPVHCPYRTVQETDLNTRLSERHTHQSQELQQAMDGAKADDEVHVPQFFCATDVLDIRSSVQIVIGQAGAGVRMLRAT